MMNRLDISAIALALGLVFGSSAMAQGVSKDDYKASKEQIKAGHKAANDACKSLSGNQKDICVAEAKGMEKIALADLEASYKPTRNTQYEARVARAEADYAVAKERCDDLAGQAKDVCVKEAKAAETLAKADAKAQMKTADVQSDKAGDESALAKEK